MQTKFYLPLDIRSWEYFILGIVFSEDQQAGPVSSLDLTRYILWAHSSAGVHMGKSFQKIDIFILTKS